MRAVADGAFDDVIAGNAAYAGTFRYAGLTGLAAKHLAIVTCIDSRIDPLGMLGLAPGDAKILRNAGARVTEDVLRSLVLASNLLDVNRVMVIAHTDCRMASDDESEVHGAIARAGGPDTRSLQFLVARDQVRALCDDVQRIRSYPYLAGIDAGGFVYDVTSGTLKQVC
jgi:carbonic anhydrase